LALSTGGRLRYERARNLDLTQGTIEMWVALRADGSDPIYSSQWHVLFFYRAPSGDSLYIAQSQTSGILYAGGNVNGQWQSAYGSKASTRAWKAGEWHHIAFTYSASGNFMRFYVDGVLTADTNEHHYWPPASDGTDFYIGGPASGEPAHYWIDEVRLSGRVADGKEIAARAQQLDAPRANEVWLPTTQLQIGDSIIYEFTPATDSETGSACSSTPWTYPGIPVTNSQPPSTVLAPGATQVDLSVTSLENTSCAYAVGTPRSYDQMTPFSQGAGTKTHRTMVTGLSADPNTINHVYVRCAAHPDYVMHLLYRSRSSVNPSFPRTGNLWGWWDFLDKGAAYIARIDLWLGADFAPDMVRQLRQLNPNILILTSINAVENDGLPDDYYLKDVNGHKIEVWPGSFRLNLTKAYVAEYQAQYAYQRMLDGGLMYDGVFFDNVMTTQSWLTHDIYGNPVQIDADEDGQPDDAATLDANWKAGVFHEIQTFRQMMPYAIVNGHSLNIYEPGIAELFNGVSLGFVTANVLEGEMEFPELWDEYNQWMTQAQSPRITMFESSPLDQIAYGYDYSPEQKIPTSTLEFARTYYPWMRFGLALTLMNDGYFAHEFGDTWHGNDWWYDELDFDLGYPSGPAQRVDTGFDLGPNRITNGGFESALASTWSLWANSGSGSAAYVSRDTSTAIEGTASARVHITSTSGTDWHVEFYQSNRSLEKDSQYDLTFWAKSNVSRTITLDSQKGSADWDNYGLWQPVSIDPTWQLYTVSFKATATVTDARIMFLVGAVTGTVWLDDVRLTLHAPDVFQRKYTNGLALLNASKQLQTINVGPGYRRLLGNQAPRFETILDDSGAVLTGTWSQVNLDSGEWKASGPFYHNWGGGSHILSGTLGEACWQLPISATDTYTVSAWWPAAPEATTWNPSARYEVVAGGNVVISATLNQTTGGDEWHLIGAIPLSPQDDTYVRLICQGAPCIADALYLRTQSRYNDGTPAESVTLQPLDGIVLRRENPPRAYLPIVLR
jgi:hypothetical protein